MGKSPKRKTNKDKQPEPSVKPSIAPKIGLWPADQVERRPIGELLAYPQNPMQHSDDQIAKIAASMREFGWTIPCLVDERGVLIAGHGRLRAAQTLGLAEVPVMTARGWTEEQKRAYRIADNQLPRLALFDETMLKLELTDLKLADYPIEFLGFEDAQLVSFMAGVGTSGDPEATPEPPAVPVSRTGDLWLLGKHRLLCGDATSNKDHNRVIDGREIDAVIADPPYGVGIDYDGFEDNETNIKELIQRALPLMRRWPVVALTTGQRMMWDYPKPTWMLIWIHPAGMGSGPWGFTMANPILVYGSDPYLKHRLGGRGDALVLAADREQNKGHPVAKPVEVWKWLIERVTVRPDSVILDPFCGSGTTLVVAEQTGREVIALELSPRYVDVAVMRWQAYAQKKAILAGTSESFDEIAAERSAEALADE